MYDGFVDELVELLEHKASTDDVSTLVWYALSSAVLPPFLQQQSVRAAALRTLTAIIHLERDPRCVLQSIYQYPHAT